MPVESATPLSRTLGIVAGARGAAGGAPESDRASLEALPDRTTFVAQVDAGCVRLGLFTADRATRAKSPTRDRELLASRAIVRVSWPGKASRVAAGITVDVSREVALPMGFVDVEACTVDDEWSGAQRVVRKSLR